MATQLRMTRAAELEALPQLRQFIEDAAKKANINDDVIYELKLAVDEACANIVMHGYAGMDPGSIILDLKLEPHQVTMVITDFGHPFEPSDAPTPDINAPLEERNIGGLGLYFIYNTMSSVDYKTDQYENKLILVKKL